MTQRLIILSMCFILIAVNLIYLVKKKGKKWEITVPSILVGIGRGIFELMLIFDGHDPRMLNAISNGLVMGTLCIFIAYAFGRELFYGR